MIHSEMKEDPPLHILIVEDNTFLRHQFDEAFNHEFTISTAIGVEDGWQIYQNRNPDVVFVDIKLRDGSGHELAHKIKEAGPTAFVVMATASDRKEDKDEAIHNHVDDYITKPFNRKKIVDSINRYWKTRSAAHILD